MKSFIIKTWNNNCVEAIKYDGKKWINEKHLEKALGYKNLASNKTQFYSDEFKKRRCEIQDCEDFQPSRKFIAEELAVHLIIDIKTVEAAELKIKLGFNQVDPIMSKQELTALRLEKAFLGEEIMENFSARNYLIDFYFPKYKLAVEIDELGHGERDSVKENKTQTETAKYLDWKFIRINPNEYDFSSYDGLGKIFIFFDEFNKREIKNLEKENEELRKEKNYLKEKMSKRLLELEFNSKSNHSIKSKCLKWIVKKILPIL